MKGYLLRSWAKLVLLSFPRPIFLANCDFVKWWTMWTLQRWWNSCHVNKRILACSRRSDSGELPSPHLLFIAFFTSHCSPLSERLEQANWSCLIADLSSSQCTWPLTEVIQVDNMVTLLSNLLYSNAKKYYSWFSFCLQLSEVESH